MKGKNVWINHKRHQVNQTDEAIPANLVWIVRVDDIWCKFLPTANPFFLIYLFLVTVCIFAFFNIDLPNLLNQSRIKSST